MKPKILNIDLSKLSRKSKNKIINALKAAYDEVSPKYVDYSLKTQELESDQEELLRLNEKYKRVTDEYYEIVRALWVFEIAVDF